MNHNFAIKTKAYTINVNAVQYDENQSNGKKQDYSHVICTYTHAVSIYYGYLNIYCWEIDYSIASSYANEKFNSSLPSLFCWWMNADLRNCRQNCAIVTIIWIAKIYTKIKLDQYLHVDDRMVAMRWI